MDECQIFYTLGVGTAPPPATINPDVRPHGTYETLKISGLYCLTAKELAGKRPACLRSMHRPSTPSQILLCSPGLHSLLLWPISPSSLLFAAISPSLLLLPYLGKIGNGQHTTDKGSYPNEVGLATVCLVSFAALFWMSRNAPPKFFWGSVA